ncbi:hypothetical protein CA51_24470 [Rosistilla oblonga]|nr:hypothetical protein CA51_24470 [Rosistilla oblonga]
MSWGKLEIEREGITMSFTRAECKLTSLLEGRFLRHVEMHEVTAC